MNTETAAPEKNPERPDSEKDMLLTIGVFDGVHTGHRHLIAELVRLAKERGLASGVLTFRPHPLEVLAPSTVLPYLCRLEERVSLLKNQGVNSVIVLPFTRGMANMSAREFVSFLQKHFRIRGLVGGPDFALGRGREGNIDVLQKLGAELGFTVTVVPPKRTNGDVVSSTAIRQALADGNVAKANRLLGRAFSLQGEIVRGEGRGGPQVGFPTINLQIDPNQALPADGVYATRTHIDTKTYQSMTNIGKNPTFGENKRTIETYIIDFEGDLYGQKARVDFIERIRDEKRFASVADLKKQIAEDVERGKAILATSSEVETQK